MKTEKIKLTFKKQSRSTGLMSVGHPFPITDIKINKKIMGYISPPAWDTKNVWTIHYSIKKSVPDNNMNCDWKWLNVPNEFDTEKDARLFVKEHIQSIINRFVLHFTDN